MRITTKCMAKIKNLDKSYSTKSSSIYISMDIYIYLDIYIYIFIYLFIEIHHKQHINYRSLEFKISKTKLL